MNKHYECCASKGYANPEQKPHTVNLKSRLPGFLWKVQILSRDSCNWGFPITPRGAGNMNFFPLHSSMHRALLFCLFDAVSSTFKYSICREADTSPFGFLSHNRSGWINVEVANIYSQNTGSFVPVNMCYLSALGFGFTQQHRHESHCSQQSAVSYYLQHKVDCCYCGWEFHLLQPWDTLLPCTDTFLARGINALISISIPPHALHFGTQHLIDVNVNSMKLDWLKHHIHWPRKEATGEYYKGETTNCATYRLMACNWMNWQYLYSH